MTSIYFMDSNKPMKYYIIRGSSDPVVLGNKTGFKQADINRDGFTDPVEYDRIQADLGSNRYWEIRDSIPLGGYDIQCVDLLKGSNLTDFLRFGPFLFNCPFMISTGVDRVIAGHKNSGVTTFQARVRRKDGEFVDYKLLHIVPMPLEMIDFSNSSFYIGDDLTGREALLVENGEQLRAMLENGKRVKVEEVRLKSTFSSLDLFALHNGEVVVSERLKAALETKKLTSGVNLLPAFGQVSWPRVAASG